MVVSDRDVGNLLHTVSTLGLIYYLLWILGTPFVDVDHPFHRFFPPKEYGVVLPALFLGFIVTFLLTFAAVAISMASDEDESNATTTHGTTAGGDDQKQSKRIAAEQTNASRQQSPIASSAPAGTSF